ncbi:MAG: hypothetical protein FD146_1567 [Anaerolineaceae bacterium]|nr:MAG: hypothetical protein FD146_1567 [Anaerolineaceae bacterium]
MGAPADMKDPKTWLVLAEMKLDHARQIFAIGLFDDAISRAYYAMFYAAKAALLSKGLDLRRHSASIAKFRELFVITGQVDAEYLHYLGQAQSARERSDYAPFAPVSGEGAKEILEAAGTFIAKVKEILG